MMKNDGLMRGTGRTRAMVMELPEDGAIVVVHTWALGDYIKQMIRDLRGPVAAHNIEIAMVEDHYDALHLQRLWLDTRKPIFVDHAFHNGVVDGRVHKEVGMTVELAETYLHRQSMGAFF